MLRSDANDVGLHGDGTCTRLAAPSNVPGVPARAAGADRLALSPSSGLRGLPASRQAPAKSLAPVFDPSR